MEILIENKQVDPKSSGPKAPQAPKACGMWLVMAAMLLNMMATDKYANQGLAPVMEKVEERNLTVSDAWLHLMQHTDIAHLNDDYKHHQKKISVDTSKFNMHSTMYNQASTWFGSLTQAGQTNIGNANDVFGMSAKMFQEILGQLKTLFR